MMISKSTKSFQEGNDLSILKIFSIFIATN